VPNVIRYVVATVGLSCCVVAQGATPSLEISGRVTEVELYPDQALVTRLIEVPQLAPGPQAVVESVRHLADSDRIRSLQQRLQGPHALTPSQRTDIQTAIDALRTGPVEIVVSDLPQYVVGRSLFVEDVNQCTLRSVSFQPVPKPQTVDTKALDARLERVAVDIAANKLETKALADRKATLTKLEQFLLAPATMTFTKEIFNFDQPERLVDYLTAQRNEIVDAEEDLANALFDLNSHKDTWTKERKKLLAKKPATVHGATVLIDKRQAIVSFRLRYLVTQVSWSPSYKLSLFVARRANPRYELDRIALIRQASGEDWFDVTLTLSVQPPLLAATAPTLNPFPSQPLRRNLPQALFKGIENRQRAEIRARSFAGSADLGAKKDQKQFSPLPGTVNPPSQSSLDDDLNLAAGEAQMMELVNIPTPRAEGTSGGQPSGPNPALSGFVGPNANPLHAHVNLSNADDPQVLRIGGTRVTRTTIAIRKIAIPILSPYVYDEVEIRNGFRRPLPPGPMAVYRNGRLVGQVELKEVPGHRSFKVGLGIDPQLSTKRELVSRTPDASGNITLTYKLTVKNSGPTGVGVILSDRLPNIPGYGLNLTVYDHGHPRDPVQNILTWDVFVPGGSDGSPFSTVPPVNAAGNQPPTGNYSFRLEKNR
jgi:hypothetical protein